MKHSPPSAGLALIAGAVALVSILASALEQAPPPRGGDVAPAVAPQAPAPAAAPGPQYDYTRLRQKITYGRAMLADARRALTDPDPVSLSNTIHALYTMRQHRGVIHLLDGMWAIDEAKFPELAWQQIARPPARIALASTLNRIRIVRTETYINYVRAHKDDAHEFNRAQVAVALGFNAHLDDLSYLEAMSDGDNHYVAQSAITGLSLFGGKQARNILIKLADKYRGTSRGDLMTEMLRQAYRWPPPKPVPPATENGPR
jgi:hypothetical protein